LNIQACLSVDTFDDEIAESGAIRVFARSAFEYGHDPDATAVEAAPFAVVVVHTGPAWPDPPHAAISTLPAPSRAMHAARRLELALIGLEVCGPLADLASASGTAVSAGEAFSLRGLSACVLVGEVGYQLSEPAGLVNHRERP
jgi:hypothetical protein